MIELSSFRVALQTANHESTQRVIRSSFAPNRSFSLNPVKETAETVTAIVESIERSCALVKSTSYSLQDYAFRIISQVSKWKVFCSHISHNFRSKS